MRLHLSGTIILLTAVLTLSGCRTYYAARSDSDRIDTSTSVSEDQQVIDIIEPYRQELAASMNNVIADLEIDLIKEQPESNLGNHVAQITWDAAQRSVGRTVDFAIMNYGGIRVTALYNGPLLVSDAYQVMPFDNFIVVMDLQGSVIMELMDQLAGYGGWPVHNMSYKINNGRAEDIRIGGEELLPEKVYSMAITDYLADGGDHLEILKQHRYYNTGILLRDAIIDAWKDTTESGMKVKAVKDGRVTIK